MAKAFIQWGHVDGPLLVCSDGTPHWLSKIEQLWLKIGLTTIELLDSKYNKEPTKG